MRVYILIWILVTGALGFEYWAMLTHPELSVLLKAQKAGYIDSSTKIHAGPGGYVSLWLGWIGLAAMIIMNVYSIRKRSSAMASMGSLRSWLNFHVFCGLVGPTLILFHCELKVRGVVGIAFWSMMVSFSSGIIGRYFYLQLLRKKSDYDLTAQKWLSRLYEILKKSQVQADETSIKSTLKAALDFVGADVQSEVPNVFSIFFSSLLGDLRLMFSDPKVPSGWPPSTRIILNEYAVNVRRGRALIQFQRLMGMWHAFHFPFAVFMYVAAVIHVISSLIFLRAS